MSTQVQYRRGSSTQNDAFTGALAEITVDTTNNVLRVHNGVTAGGFTLAGLTATQTLTNKTISSATFTGTQTGTANINLTGTITASGNVQGNYFIGNGSQLTGIDATSIQNGTSNVKTILNGNVTISSAGQANVVVVTSTGANVAGYLTASGNITGGNLSGTSIVGTLTTAAQTNITSVGTLGSLSVTGNITGGNLSINTDAVITGNLTVNGTTTTINSNTITTNDLNITVGNNQTTGTALNGAGLDVGSNSLATWRFNNATTSWQSNIAVMPTANGTLTLGGPSNYWGAAYVASLTASGNITGSYILGNGSQLTGIDATSIQNGSSNVKTILNGNVTISSAGTANVVVITSTGANIAGTLNNGTGNANLGNLGVTSVVATNLTGTLQTAAQTNITSVGTLSSLSVTGTITGGSLSVSTGTITGGNIVNANANGVGNIGSSTTYFNTVFAKATSAQYADLAENYVADKDYPIGTLLMIGGPCEVRDTQLYHDPKVVGTVSDKPAYIMNSGLAADHVVTVALLGRVPCRVVGTIGRGDLLVASKLHGVATVLDPDCWTPGCVIGKALEEYNSDEPGVIEIMVGRY